LGVHVSFVRSVDLDEWTQKQLDAMRLGGNGPARTYFRSHGLTDLHTRIDKKYTSKAAMAYRTELQRLVEGSSSSSSADEANLLANLSLADQASLDQLAKEKLAAARSANGGATPAVGTAEAKNSLASQNPNAKGVLLTPPSSGNLGSFGGTAAATTSSQPVMLRKLSSGVGSSTSGNLFKAKKKPIMSGVKLSSSSLSTTSADKANGADHFDTFEDPAPEVPATALSETSERSATAPAAAATAAVPISPPLAAPAATTTATPSPGSKKNVIEDGVARLKMMNSDFFANM
jgi:ADP-ribosylation factor GTPase-activating protein 2/3